MRNPRRIVASAGLTFVTALAMSCASEPSGVTSAKPTLAIEFPPEAPEWAHTSPRRLPVPANGETGTEVSTDDLNPLPGTDPGRPPMTVALGFTAEGDKVVVSVHALPPESDPLRWSDDHRRLLAMHSAHLNETIELTELKKIGFEPFSLKVVKAVPPPAVHPELISKVPSITIAHADDGMATYQDLCAVVLHNNSSRPVLAYILAGARSGDQESTGTQGRPAIAPQADTRPQVVSCSAHAPGSDAKESAQPQIIVAAALFSDGAVEGDDNFAVRLKTGQMAKALQYQRIAPIIDRILLNPSMNDDARIAGIKEEIFRLPTEADPAAIRTLQAQFPALPTEVISRDMGQSLDRERNELWHMFYPYEQARATPSMHPPALSRLWQDARRNVQ